MAMTELKFLVVDDMMTMRKIVSQQLRAMGVVTIEEANDGTVAWNKMEEAAKLNKPFQFIVSDWNMPEMKGIDLLKKARAHPTYKTVAFLLVTAESEMDQVKEAVASGVDNYLVKPFTPQSFQEKLMAAYQRRFPGK
ncbi:MAG: response regulator [Bdellovibrionales bacterium]|nr:response regulator [Bdellovibrionales bacterium]